MKNITKLSIWPELKALGFIPIRFKAHGKVVAVGCALQQEHKGLDNATFKSDIICIEPKNYKVADNRTYHITGQIKTPFYDTAYYRDHCNRKVETQVLRDTMNEFYTVKDILKTVQLMLK